MDDSDLSSIRYFVSVGSKLSDDLYEAVQAHLPNGNLYCGYGMSEKSGMITLNCPIPKPSSVGLLSTGYHMKIVDENGDRCGINEDGEIGLKSNFKFLGYYDNEEITSSAFDSDGWFLTGDIGHCDEDGYLYIVDRKKDLLKYCNYQVSPTEIESILLKHPGIKQVTVIGIPDPASTELPAAVIVKHDDVDVSADEVMEMVAGKSFFFLNPKESVILISEHYYEHYYRSIIGCQAITRWRIFCGLFTDDTVWESD